MVDTRLSCINKSIARAREALDDKQHALSPSGVIVPDSPAGGDQEVIGSLWTYRQVCQLGVNNIS